jgi:hypothetical protein
MIAINRPRPALPWKIDVQAKVSQLHHPPGQALTIQYICELMLGNPNRHEIEFEVVIFTFRRLSAGYSLHDCVAQRITRPSSHEICNEFYYSESLAEVIGKSSESSTLQTIRLAANQAMTFHKCHLGPVRKIDDDPGPLEVCLHLVQAGAEIIVPMLGSLPARAEIPVADPWGKKETGLSIRFRAIEQE